VELGGERSLEEDCLPKVAPLPIPGKEACMWYRDNNVLDEAERTSTY